VSRRAAPPDPPVQRAPLHRWVLRLGVSATVLAVLLFILPWEEVRSAASQLTIGIFAIALAGFVAAHLIGAVKWWIMLRASTGGTSLGAAQTVGCYGSGLFANLFLPTVVGGDVVRAALAARALGRTEAVVAGSVADRVIDMAALAVLVAVGGLFAGGVVTGWGAPLLVLLAVVLLAGAAVLVPLLFRRPLSRWPLRIRRRVGRTLLALRHLRRRPGPAAAAFILALVVQSTLIVVTAWLGAAVGAEAPLWAWFVAWPLAKAAGMLPITVGGLGVRDAALAALLVPFGVPLAIGFTASLAWDAVLIAGALLGGLTGLILRPGARERAVPGPRVSTLSTE
jgi:glycosyltransferase 2 family protein